MQTPARILLQGVHRGEEACCEHLASVRALQPARQAEHDYLYECLGVLDVKAQALLAFDSVLLVAASLAIPHVPEGLHVSSVFVVASLVLAAVAAAACLPVIWLTWTDTKDLLNEDALFIKLLQARNQRTVLYRLSWIFAAVSMLTLVIGVVADYGMG